MTKQTKPRNRLITAETKLVVSRSEGVVGMGELGEKNKELQNSSFKIISHKDERCGLGNKASNFVMTLHGDRR